MKDDLPPLTDPGLCLIFHRHRQTVGHILLHGSQWIQAARANRPEGAWHLEIKGNSQSCTGLSSGRQVIIPRRREA